MNITSIKQQVKRAERYSIYVDGKYSFSLGEHELLKLGLYSGQEVSSEQLAGYQDESAYGKWFDRTLNLLSFRLRSEWELRDYLRRKDCPGEITQRIIDRLTANGYVDDERFAKMWVENRRLLKATSRRKLQQELQQKRISRTVIDSVLGEDKTVTDERAILAVIVEKKKHRYPDRVKFMQYLARQGFSYDDIKYSLDSHY